jgi:RNA-directed DNA polymerase
MGAKQQKNQLSLAFAADSRGETPTAATQGTEASMAKLRTESPVSDERVMEEIVSRENLKRALQRVKANQGSPGIDGMTVGELPQYLTHQWPSIREQLLSGTYTPQPVKRVEIPKPEGGVRKLGIPTVLDRFIQQAMLQVLQAKWDASFSDHSYGFRPHRSAHQAVEQAQQYIAEGYRWVVDLDLEKFFDRVNHDKLMGTLAKRLRDKRVLKLIRGFLQAGVLEGGLVSPTEEGTPQGGPLSPLLSNLVLDELDKELERRGHRFVRYADDSNLYVRSLRAGERVMESITRFITRRLKLVVNEAKSAVARPGERKLLGFSFTRHRAPKRRIAPQAVKRFKKRIRTLTQRTRGRSLETLVEQVNSYLRGWQGYFGFCQTPSVFGEFDAWLRRRLRSYVWKQWGRTGYRELRRRGVSRKLAWNTAKSAHGPWRLSQSPALSIALPAAFFDSLGLLRLAAPH